MVQITVDLSADKATLARVAQLILQFAGYEPPVERPRDDVQNIAVDRGPVTHPLLEPVDEPPVDDDGANVWNLPVGRVDALDPTQAFAPIPDFYVLSGAERRAAALPLEVPTFVPPPPPPPAGIDVDARGLPWDPRIHASTRAKTADGSWRQKRGTDPQEVIRVEAELRQTMSLPAPAVPPVPPVPVAPPAPPAPVVPPVPFAGNAAPPAPPVSTSAPVASPGAAPSASPGSSKFVQLVQAITKAVSNDKTLTKAQVDAALQKHGIAMLPLLHMRPDLVGAVATELGIAL